ncbi:MAG: chitinase [Chlamydiae bacterium]|nr:chitinase [Chlamydiota bacterium]
MKLLSVIALASTLISSSLRGDEPVVGAYYENWSQYRPPSGGRARFYPNLIDPTIITDLYYAFAVFGFVTNSIDPGNAHLTGDYTVQPVEWNDQSVLYPQVMALKAKNPHLRNLLSIGGWSFNDPNDPNGMGQKTYRLFSQMVASQDNRAQFITSAIDYAHKYGFDGIDIDWEYPGDLTRGGTPEDFANFVTFLQEAYTALHAASPPLLLTYASAAIVPSGVPQSYHDNPSSYFAWLAACASFLDRFNIMAYDYHGPFDNPMLTGVNAPLTQDTDPQSLLFIKETVENYLNGGVPASKMVLGMPTYGHSYAGVSSMTSTSNGPGKPFTSAGPAGPSTGTPGMLAYFEVADCTATGTLTFGTDAPTSTAYGYNLSTTEWVSFDTPDTIALKVQLAKDYKLLGGMFWAVDDDEYQWGEKYPNIRKGYSLFYPSQSKE